MTLIKKRFALLYFFPAYLVYDLHSLSSFHLRLSSNRARRHACARASRRKNKINETSESGGKSSDMDCQIYLRCPTQFGGDGDTGKRRYRTSLADENPARGSSTRSQKGGPGERWSRADTVTDDLLPSLMTSSRGYLVRCF